MITKKLVPVNLRTTITADLFGVHYPFRLEPAIFGLAENLSEDYTGAYWDMWTLSNGGFYMCPSCEDLFSVSSMNGFEDQMSNDAFGITACLYAYNHLSFCRIDGFEEVCAEHYYDLRDFMLEHPEAGLILRAID
ncbi:MAG: antirestriction protein [Methylococcales bacterium]|nr:antirestriction protein [Methylococcales bacterium]